MSEGTEVSDGEAREYHFKILIVGDGGSGKSCILQRYINNTFSSKFKTTIGVDFLLKEVQWDSNTFLRLQFWDIAGQERFGHMTQMYYREAVGAFVVYDLTEPKTFDAVPKWKQDLNTHLNFGDYQLPVVLLGNKVDIYESEIDKEAMDKFCQENGFAGWLKTSAKTGENVNEAVVQLVTEILKNEIPQQEAKGNVIVTDTNDELANKSGCC